MKVLHNDISLSIIVSFMHSVRSICSKAVLPLLISSQCLAGLGVFSVPIALATHNGVPECNGVHATIWVNAGNNHIMNGTTDTGVTYTGTLNGTNGADVIVGSSGDDVINGDNQDDTICGGNGNDTLNGGNGKDWIDGEGGNDTVDGDAGQDDLFGGDGNDKIFGANGGDDMDGGPGTDFCDQQNGPGITGCEATENEGILTIAKDAIPDHEQDFSFTAAAPIGIFSLDDDTNGTLPNTRTFTLSGATAPTGTNYTVTEDAVSGWNVTSIICDDTGDAGTTTNTGTRSATVNLDEGDIVTCTFTNTQSVCGNNSIESGEQCDDGNTENLDLCNNQCVKNGKLKVVKETIGGDDTFGFSGSGFASFNLSTGNGTATTEFFVLPGTYTVNETTVPTDWQMQSNSCQNIDVASEETETCTVKNTKSSRIVIEKHTTGGFDQFDFTGTNPPMGSFSLITDANTNPVSSFFDVFIDVDTQYNVMEQPESGWNLVDISCSDSDGTGFSPAGPSVDFTLKPGHTMTCSFENTKSVCGNGDIENGEICDDGNQANGDGCSSNCQQESGWTCQNEPSVCVTTCGDGITAGTEECDDQNTNDLDACSNACTINICADSVDNDTDTFVDAADPGCYDNGNTVTGTYNPKDSDETNTAVCGNGTIDQQSEQCDDGNVVNGDGCSSTCQTTVQCSDTVDNTDAEDTLVDAADPGCHTDGNAANSGSYDAQDNDETHAFACQNGVTEGSEECDDGNAVNDDACTNACTAAACGDGIRQAGQGEQCDDGNTANNDGCSSVCIAEGGLCNDQAATIYVKDGKVVGGPLNGQPFNGALVGTSGNDVIVGTDGPDGIRGNDGNDVICAKGANDGVDAGNGDDIVFGGDGSDGLKGGGGNDKLYGEGGFDSLEGGAHNDFLSGGTETDGLKGGDGDDVLCGGPGNGDALSGDLGSDRMDGGPGFSDALSGGIGFDICKNGEALTACENTTTPVPECAP